MRLLSLIYSFLLLIFTGNMLVRCYKSNAVFLLLSTGIIVFFLIYGSNKNLSIFIKFNVYGMLLASALVMLSIVNLMLKKQSKHHSQLEIQSKKINSLRIDIANLKIRFSIMRREVEWHFSDLCIDNKICTDLKQKCFLPTNKKIYYDFYVWSKVIKLLVFSLALLIFLYQFFYSYVIQESKFIDLFIYCVLILLFLFIIVIDKLIVYYSENYYGIKDNQNTINCLSAELKAEEKQYAYLLNKISLYNALSDKNEVNQDNCDILRRHKEKIFNALNRD